jgi:hypothetical protein
MGERERERRDKEKGGGGREGLGECTVYMGQDGGSTLFYCESVYEQEGGEGGGGGIFTW